MPAKKSKKLENPFQLFLVGYFFILYLHIFFSISDTANI